MCTYVSKADCGCCGKFIWRKEMFVRNSKDVPLKIAISKESKKKWEKTVIFSSSLPRTCWSTRSSPPRAGGTSQTCPGSHCSRCHTRATLRFDNTHTISHTYSNIFFWKKSQDRFIIAIARTFPLFMTLAWVYSASMIIKVRQHTLNSLRNSNWFESVFLPFSVHRVREGAAVEGDDAHDGPGERRPLGGLVRGQPGGHGHLGIHAHSAANGEIIKFGEFVLLKRLPIRNQGNGGGA